MIKLIIGEKGTGKTKKLIEKVNDALSSSNGNVVCVEKKDLLRFQINYKARLVTADAYGINGYEAFYGLLCGLCAGDHDITDILVDATLKIAGTKDGDALCGFLKKIKVLSDLSGTDFTFTVSMDKDKLPSEIFEFCEEL